MRQKTLTNDARRSKMTTLLLDAATREKLEALSLADEDQPGNRSAVVRRLIRRAYASWHAKINQK